MDESDVRLQLAAAYRLADRLGLSTLVATHISARLPGAENHFLFNAYDLLFNEIAASNLVKIDWKGNIIGNSNWSINPAGFTIHSAILAARQDVNCVIHTRSRYGVAVSSLECGLLPITQFAMRFYNQLAYHNYEWFS